MATYIALINWTDQGIKNFKDSPKRADAFGEMIGKAGGSVKGIWWTIGPYDIVAVVEAPDEDALTATLLQVGAQGNVRTTTLRAFDQSQFSSIIEKAG
jgi:uncharacterized protein with GYD domain